MADIFTIIERIRTTWQSGHRIVPIVGAGLSVDSGVPIVSSLMRYLAKFDRYLEHSVYLPFRGAEDTVRPLESYESTFRRDPSEFVQSFGWPDRFDLNQHLLASLERRSRAGPKGDGRDDEFGLDSQINAAYSAILKKVAKEKFDRYDRLIDSIVDRLPAEKSKPSSLRETIRRSFATTETGNHPRSSAGSIVSAMNTLSAIGSIRPPSTVGP